MMDDIDIPQRVARIRDEVVKLNKYDKELNSLNALKKDIEFSILKALYGRGWQDGYKAAQKEGR